MVINYRINAVTCQYNYYYYNSNRQLRSALQMSRDTSRRFKKSVTFHQKNDNSGLASQMTRNETKIRQQQHESKSQFFRKKIFSIQECKFMSMKNINTDGSTEQSYNFDPVTKLQKKIAEMEDILAKLERSYNRKIKNLGKRFQKECENQVRLMEEVMELKTQLQKNLKVIAQLKKMIGKQNLFLNVSNSPTKITPFKRKQRPYHSPSPLSRPRLIFAQARLNKN